MSQKTPEWRILLENEIANVEQLKADCIANQMQLLEWFRWFEIRRTVGNGGRGLKYTIKVTQTKPIYLMGYGEAITIKGAALAAAANALARYDVKRLERRRRPPDGQQP